MFPYYFHGLFIQEINYLRTIEIIGFFFSLFSGLIMSTANTEPTSAEVRTADVKKQLNNYRKDELEEICTGLVIPGAAKHKKSDLIWDHLSLRNMLANWKQYIENACEKSKNCLACGAAANTNSSQLDEKEALNTAAKLAENAGLTEASTSTVHDTHTKDDTNLSPEEVK